MSFFSDLEPIRIHMNPIRKTAKTDIRAPLTEAQAGNRVHCGPLHQNVNINIEEMM